MMQIHEALDTVKIFIASNMCPRADAGEDQTLVMDVIL